VSAPSTDAAKPAKSCSPKPSRGNVRISAHDREREDVVVVHRHRRTVERALDRLAIDDDDFAAEVVDAPEAEVPDRARFGDAQARLVGAGEQRVDHGELRHGGAGHRRRSHHGWSVPTLGGHDESRNSNARSAARACCGSEPSATATCVARQAAARSRPRTGDAGPCTHSPGRRGGHVRFPRVGRPGCGLSCQPPRSGGVQRLVPRLRLSATTGTTPLALLVVAIAATLVPPARGG
jgi:hypothetical protein